MKGFLCVVSLTLLFTTLTECSTVRHPDRNQLKNSFIPALKKTNHKTPSGKYENLHVRFLYLPVILLSTTTFTTFSQPSF